METIKTTKTVFIKEDLQEHKWYLIDASGKTLGRVAAVAACIARGKRKASYTPNQEMGDYVVIINADKVKVTGKKAKDKIYYTYSTGYVGSLKSLSFDKLIEKNGVSPLSIAIKGMLPHGRLGQRIYENIKIYAGSTHPHLAQNPTIINL